MSTTSIKIVLASHSRSLQGIVTNALKEHERSSLVVLDNPMAISHVADHGSLVVFDTDQGDPEAFVTTLLGLVPYVDIQILLVTSRHNEPQARKAIPLGARGYLVRPVEPAEFRKALKRLSWGTGLHTTLDVHLVTPFLAAAEQALQEAGLGSLDRKALICKKDYRVFGDVSGVAGFTGALRGTLAVCLPYETANRLAPAAAGDADPRRIERFVASLAAGIAAKAAERFAAQGKPLQFSGSQAVFGRNFDLHHGDGSPCLAAIYTAGETAFALEVCYEACETPPPPTEPHDPKKGQQQPKRT